MPTTIDRDEVQRRVREEQAQLVEVLPTDEYDDEHLPGAINVSLKSLDGETTPYTSATLALTVLWSMEKTVCIA